MAFTRREIVATASMVALAAVASHSHAQARNTGPSPRLARAHAQATPPVADECARRVSSARR